MKSRIVAIACCFWIFSFLVSPSALALTRIELSDLSYQDCPPELAQGNVTSGGASRPANCFLIVGKAKNNSGKKVVDADVYGRIYDANKNNVFENRGRVGLIPEIPPGESDFQIRVSIPANLPTPLYLEQFHASGFTGTVSRYKSLFD